MARKDPAAGDTVKRKLPSHRPAPLLSRATARVASAGACSTPVAPGATPRNPSFIIDTAMYRLLARRRAVGRGWHDPARATLHGELHPRKTGERRCARPPRHGPGAERPERRHRLRDAEAETDLPGGEPRNPSLPRQPPGTHGGRVRVDHTAAGGNEHLTARYRRGQPFVPHCERAPGGSGRGAERPRRRDGRRPSTG